MKLLWPLAILPNFIRFQTIKTIIIRNPNENQDAYQIANEEHLNVDLRSRLNDGAIFVFLCIYDIMYGGEYVI
ncbi:hypothetical protein Hanom_Chr01g00007131 [Helianthus anomalus]